LCVLRDSRCALPQDEEHSLMPSETYLMLRSAPLRDAACGGSSGQGARLEARTAALQLFSSCFKDRRRWVLAARVKGTGNEASCHLPHGGERRWPDLDKPMAARRSGPQGRLRASARAARRRRLAHRPRHRSGIRQAGRLSASQRPALPEGVLVCPARRPCLWRRARRARQNRLGARRHRRRSDRRRADRAG
jgi:hypothetical protein